jgi:UDP-glucose 4-epimerase
LLRAGAALVGRRAVAARLLGSLEVDAQQFRDLAGWSQPHTLDEGLAATAAWWRLRHAL